MSIKPAFCMPEAAQTKPNLLDSIRVEFPVFWRGMPDKGLFFALLAAWLALFQFLGNSTFGYVDTPSLLQWMYAAYNQPDSEDAHGNLIPFVVLGLFWWKREALAGVAKRTWWPGLLGVALALALHLLGYLIQQPRVSIIAFFTGVYALLGAVWGWRFAVTCFFPFVLFAFCLPLGTVLDPVTIPLRQISTDVAVFMAREVLGIGVIQTGVQIFDPKGAYSYEVAAACSGIRSLLTLTALTTIYGFVSFKTSWKRALMVVLAVPLALVGNVLRLVTIMVAAEAFGAEAGEFVHNWFGFVTFALALAVMLGLGHLLREPEPEKAG